MIRVGTCSLQWITQYCRRFFFSSRRWHTSWTGDWSSDVCSSDLGAADAVGEAGKRIVPPRAEEGDDELRGAALDEVLACEIAQVPHDAGAKERALADAARPVDERQPGGDQVLGDDVALLLAAEEEERVLLRVRDEALVGRGGEGGARSRAYG